MFNKRISLFLVFAFISIKAFATIFVVTSNADSGAGTLREALTLAATNGSATTDYINFNIADLSETGRTISLINELPNLSSNLIIDGTTQPGTVFALSNSKIQIATPVNNNKFFVFNGTGLNNIEFYGLYIYDYSDENTSRPSLGDRIGINLLNSSNITVGAAGKGNLTRGFNRRTIYLEKVDNIKIQSNVFGLLVGKTNPVEGTANVNLIDCNNILIGGSISEGNIIFTHFSIGFADLSVNNNLSIKSNNIGVFADGYTTNHTSSSILTIYTHYNTPLPLTVAAKLARCASVNAIIEDNLMGNPLIAFNLTDLNGLIVATKNHIGIARDGTTNLNNHNPRPNTTGIGFSIVNSTAKVIIGGGDPIDKNYFGFMPVATVVEGDNSSVLIRNNEYQCISDYAYRPTIPNTLPFINITNVNTTNGITKISGKANSNAIIEIYSSEACITNQCSIRSLLETTLADNSGNWQSSALNLTGNLYALATVASRTSKFISFEINEINIVKQNIRCDFATIKGLQVTSGLNYYWIDGNNNIVSTDLDLKTNRAGKYQFVLGNGCIKSNWYDIYDERVIINDANLIKTNISCGNFNGAIKNLFVFDPLNKIKTMQWFDSNNNLVGNTKDVNSLAAGSYSFKVLTSDNCEKIYGPVTLTNTTGPNINQSQIVIQPTNCGQTIGSITGVTASGSGTLTYRWKNAQLQTVGNTANLLNQPAGTYILEVNDSGSQCGPLFSSAIIIPELNGINMTETGVQQIPSSCDNSNGSIKELPLPRNNL